MKDCLLFSSEDRLTEQAAFREQVLRRAEAHYQQNDLSAARAWLASLETRSAHTLETLQTFGNICFLLGDYEQADAAFSRVLARSPNDPDLLVSLALTSLRLNDLPGCRRCIEQALRIQPHRREALKLLADINLHQRRYAEAASIYGGNHPN